MHTSKAECCEICAYPPENPVECANTQCTCHISKENHFIDVSCPKCGHVPQSERYLCESKEEWEKDFATKFGVVMNSKGELATDWIRHRQKESYAQGYNDGARETREKFTQGFSLFMEGLLTGVSDEDRLKLHAQLQALTPTKTDKTTEV